MAFCKWLGMLVMAWLGFFYKITAVIFPLFGALHVLFIVFSDEFLSQHIKLTLVLIASFSFTCCFLTLSKICVLRRRPHSANIATAYLSDMDLTLENETEEVPHYKLSYHYKAIPTTLMNIFFKNPYEFCKFRPAYGLLLVTGFAFLFTIIAALRQAKERDIKDDLYCVAAELIIPMMLLIFLTFIIANSGFYIARRDYDMYITFEEFVQIPMKNIVGKTVAIFLTSGGTYWILVFFLISITALAIISSNYLYHASELNDALKCLLPPIFPDPRRLLTTALIITCAVFVNALAGMIVAAFTEAKQMILEIIEQNWQRNLKAIAFLLEDFEAETLQDLKTALDNKRTRQLTENEKKAFDYILWPIWQTKPPFMLLKSEGDFPAPEGNKQQDNKDEPENIQPDSNVKPASKESENADQPSQPVVPEMLQSAESSTIPKCMELRHDEPSTSSANY